MDGCVAGNLSPLVVGEHHQVGIAVGGSVLGRGLQPGARRESGHHQDTIVLLAVPDPLGHLRGHITSFVLTLI